MATTELNHTVGRTNSRMQAPKEVSDWLKPRLEDDLVYDISHLT